MTIVELQHADAPTTLRCSGPLQLRHQGHNRRVEALICPANTTSYLVPGGERFASGCWKASLARRKGMPVPLLREHDRSQGIGVVEELTETASGLRGVLVLADNLDGARALADIESGAIAGTSVGFVGLRAVRVNGIPTVLEAELGEVSLVVCPAYPAGITWPPPSPHQLSDEDAALFAWLHKPHPTPATAPTRATTTPMIGDSIDQVQWNWLKEHTLALANRTAGT